MGSPGRGFARQGEVPAAWRRMWGMFVLNHEAFLASYHRRSNVETTFGSCKRLFGASVRSKSWTAQVNEVLAKCIAYNHPPRSRDVRERH